MTEIADLKPCPFCGSSDLDMFANTVSCDQCGCDGPRQDGPEMYCDRRIAIEAWNRRALDAAHKQIAELEAALSNLLRCEYDGQGLTDCIDNHGGYYQSADLAKQIDNAEALLGLPPSPSLLNKEEENG